MRIIRRTSQFKRDAKRMLKRGKNTLALKTVLDLLTRGETLETRYRDHWLVGEYKGARMSYRARLAFDLRTNE
jgi:mRNA interferase YafQ